jgi:hypothetical protein
MTASNNRKLPKVSCPMESENDLIRPRYDANAGGMIIQTRLKSVVIYTKYRISGENR